MRLVDKNIGQGKLKLIWFFAKKYKFHFISLYICLLTETLLNMLGPMIIGFMINEVIYYRNMEFFWGLTWIYVVIMVSVSLLYFIHPKIWQYLMTKFLFDVRLRLFDRISKAHAAYLSDAKSGDLVTRINGDTSEFMHIIQRNMFHFINGFVKLGLAIAFLFYYSWKIALLMVVIIPFYVSISRRYGGIARELSNESRRAYGHYISWVFEILKSLREIKIMAADKRIVMNFVAQYKVMNGIKIKSSMNQFKATQLVELMKVIANSSLYVLAGVLAYQGDLTLGAFIAIMEYFTEATGTLSYLINNNMDMQRRKASVDRVYETLQIMTESDHDGKKELTVSHGEIKIANVSFRYAEKSPVLHDINLHINSGERIAFVGASGAGKTTLAYLLLKFYLPDTGRIQIDHTDIHDCSLQSIRRNIGIVQQNPLIYDDTIRANLSLHHQRHSDSELLEACEKASLGEFMRTLPDGLDTKVGKGGIELSGGQKQRLSIARIYLRNPKILIFDEATSALDYDTENKVLAALGDLSKGKTTITIAHRLQTVIHSDRVAVLHEGTIVSFGHHEQLFRTCPYYLKLFQDQYAAERGESA